MKQLVLFSNSLQFIKLIHNFSSFKINSIFIDSKKEELEIITYCKWNNIKVSYFSEEKIINTDFSEIDYAFTFGFNYIFSSKIINQFKEGIWNIHPGELPKYRGRHPIQWAFINGEKKIGVTIHKINEKIDRGELLGLDYVNVEVDDTEKDIMCKIFDLLKSNLLLDSIYHNSIGKTTILGKGTYYPSLQKGIQFTSFLDYTSTEFFNLLRSQKDFGGLKVKNKVYTKAYYFIDKCLGTYPNSEIITFKDNKKLILFYNESRDLAI